MIKTAQPKQYFALLDSERAKSKGKRFALAEVFFCRSLSEIEQVCDKNVSDLTWISWTGDLTDKLIKASARRRVLAPKRFQRRDERVITVKSPRPEILPTLRGLFAQIVGDSPSFQWLPKDELLEVLFGGDCDRAELALAAAADSVTETVTLIRGTFQPIVVPYLLFKPSGDGTRPDFSKIRVSDFGRTVVLGDYEAAMDAILYETDMEYRRKLRQKWKEKDRSFGASLYRLRKQRGLARDEFAPLTAKTIARIERNEIDRPHKKSLGVIAIRLGVEADEIASY